MAAAGLQGRSDLLEALMSGYPLHDRGGRADAAAQEMLHRNKRIAYRVSRSGVPNGVERSVVN